MRGKPFLGPDKRRLNRITPAYAGKTRFRPLTVARDRDHPRVCGENHRDTRHGVPQTGSPPRMRGKLIKTAAQLSSVRITPAYAGKTVKAADPANMRQDHPRVCGENVAENGKAKKSFGSPPRMRGKLFSAFADDAVMGITPAYAGKTCYTVSKPPVAQDHPRGCGENGFRQTVRENQPGSPPRMRGKPSSGALADAAGGITPADAGKTCYIMFWRCWL